MTRIYGYHETLQAMREAGEFWAGSAQVYGVSADGTGWNNYITPARVGVRMSPIGATFMYLVMDLTQMEQLSTDHIRWCEEYDCHICSEAGGFADTSLYAPWVVEYIRDRWDVEFTDQARDLLWEAESSGLTLREWYLNRLDILDAV